MDSKNKFTKFVFICSPYRATSTDPLERAEETRDNIKLARRVCETAVMCGYIPLAPHCYFTLFLDDNDPRQRADGMKLSKSWLDLADEVWVYGNRVSEGMAKEIAYASELEIPIRMMRDPEEAEQKLLEAIFGKEAMNGKGKSTESEERK